MAVAAATIVLLPLLSVRGAVTAGPSLGPGGAFCPCSKGLFPMCSSTTGDYVASSQDCAEHCGGVTDSVGFHSPFSLTARTYNTTATKHRS